MLQVSAPLRVTISVHMYLPPGTAPEIHSQSCVRMSTDDIITLGLPSVDLNSQKHCPLCFSFIIPIVFNQKE